MEKSLNKFRPILFSTPMVQAILEGRKTQTRRIVKKKYSNTDLVWHEMHSGKTKILIELQNDTPAPRNNGNGTTTHTLKAYKEVECPYEVGDVLWVRENFYTASNWDHWKPSMLKSVNVEVFYVADLPNYDIPRPLSRGKIRPCIFLPFEYARIFLKIKSIKVEKLQDISEIDAINEGVLFNKFEHSTKTLSSFFFNYLSKEFKELTAKLSFESLWISINKQESWKSNPFVFVYEFEQIEKPLDFIV